MSTVTIFTVYLNLSRVTICVTLGVISYLFQYICILIVFKYNKIILTHSLMAFGTFHNIFVHSDGILEFIS